MKSEMGVLQFVLHVFFFFFYRFYLIALGRSFQYSLKIQFISYVFATL